MPPKGETGPSSQQSSDNASSSPSYSGNLKICRARLREYQRSISELRELELEIDRLRAEERGLHPTDWMKLQLTKMESKLKNDEGNVKEKIEKLEDERVRFDLKGYVILEEDL